MAIKELEYTFHMLTSEIKSRLRGSVLCWLATSSADNVPNVSPKEVFDAYDDSTVVIANIASPQSAANIRENEKVCVSFVEILVQKGFQLQGTAQVVKKIDADFVALSEPLLRITEGKFPFATIFKVSVTHVKSILAPRYLLYPDTTEQEQIDRAVRAYGFKRQR